MAKRKPRMITCPECEGRRESVAVVCIWPDGHTTPGISNRNVDCETCGSTGKVKARAVKACCCSGPADERCKGCQNAYGLIHVCEVPTDDELDREAALMTMPSPQTGRGHSPEIAAILGQHDLSNGERAPRETK